MLAGTAALGSYTTFSTWMLETHRLAEDGELRRAAINAVGAASRSASARRRSGGRSERDAVNEDCLKLTTYFGERDRTPAGPARATSCSTSTARGVRASVLLRGAEGFGRLSPHAHRPPALALGGPAGRLDRRRPRERIEAPLERVLAIKRRGLITLERARLLSGSAARRRVARRRPGDAAKLTVYLGRQERVG